MLGPLWGLILLGLLMRALRQPTMAGTYSARLDELLYAGQRLLEGQLLFDRLYNGTLPLAQWLYAPSAWLGTITAHRVLTVGLDGVAGALLALALSNLARVGLLVLVPGSLLPLAGAMLYGTMAQMLPGGSSGLLEHFANLFLVMALCLFGHVATSAREGDPFHALRLAGAGAALVLAMGACPRWMAPLLTIAVVSPLLLRLPRLLSVLMPVLAGGLVAVCLLFSPYLLFRAGPSLAWAGSVLLPLELARRFPPEINRSLPLFGELLGLKMAGLPVWLIAVVPCLALLAYVVRSARHPLAPADQSLLIPALATVFLLETLRSFLRGGLQAEEISLLIVPLAIIIVSGFAVLEGSPLGARGVALVLLVLSLILFNNVFLVSLLHAPRQPSALVQALEADREATRLMLLDQPKELRGFTAPQDVALQRQLRQRATTTGIGPEWSLNQQNLQPSWATRRLALPTDPSTICRQLTDPSNHHLVWMRTDPDGPNTEAFFRACLDREPGQWQDISADLKLTTGEYRVFRRRALPAPAPGAQPAP
jgi:hypothetical protein